VKLGISRNFCMDKKNNSVRFSEDELSCVLLYYTKRCSLSILDFLIRINATQGLSRTFLHTLTHILHTHTYLFTHTHTHTHTLVHTHTHTHTHAHTNTNTCMHTLSISKQTHTHSHTYFHHRTLKKWWLIRLERFSSMQ